MLYVSKNWRGELHRGTTEDGRGWTAWQPAGQMPRATNAFYSRTNVEVAVDEVRFLDPAPLGSFWTRYYIGEQAKELDGVMS